jgi:threonine dehydratase
VLKNTISLQGSAVVVIVSGGNVDPALFARLLDDALSPNLKIHGKMPI